MKNVGIKILGEVVNLLFNNRLVFAVVRQLQLFDAVFVMYPANAKFADHFTFRVRQRLITWRPFIIGMAKHPSGKRTLMFAISAFVDGKDSGDSDGFRLLHDRVETLRQRIGATTTHFAGTLPGRFTALKVRRGVNQKNERVATQENVVGAVMQLRDLFCHKDTYPVIILGSQGYIGKEVVAQLVAKDVHVIGIDKGVDAVEYVKPGVPHIVVNITAPEAINQYIDSKYMDHNTILLNEVYPAPHADVVSHLHELGVLVYHIAGVEAEAIPPFPGSYRGALPCCAAIPGEGYSVKIIEL